MADNKNIDDNGIEESYLVDDLDDIEEIDYGKLYASAMSNEYTEKTGGSGSSKKSWITVVAVAVAVVVLIVAGVFIRNNIPSKEVVNMDTYFGQVNEPFMLVNYERSELSVIKYEGHYYIPMDFVSEFISDKFYYDEGNKNLLYTTSESIFTIPLESAEYYENSETRSEAYIIARMVENKMYLAIDFAYGKGPFSYTVYENPDRLSVVFDNQEYNSVALKSKGVVRTEAGIHNPYFADDAQGSVWVTDGKAKDGWLPVKSEDGRKGFAKTSQVESSDKKIVYNSFYVPERYSSVKKDYDIVLAWHAIYNKSANDNIETLLANTSGVTTISPTWYKVISAEGDLDSFADAEYVKKLQDDGYEVWALISDFTSVDKENGWDEKALFANTLSRRKLIDNIMTEIETYGYDGINLDFEVVPKTAGDDFIQFIRELSIKMRAAGKVLSVDNGVPSEARKHYNIKAQGECVDYVIIMGYDEHWASCPEAGSVASLPFVVKGIEDTISMVPKEKTINAMPFYTRLWISEKDSDGTEKLSSRSLAMQDGLDFVTDNNLKMSWDEEVGQYVATGEIAGVKYSIWLEETDSMRVRFKAVKEQGIAGIAGWRLGFELKEIWDIFDFDK